MSTSALERMGYLANWSARDIANSLFQKWAVKGFFRRVSVANRGRGQPRRGYRRPKPTAHSDVGRLRSRRAAGFLLHTFLSPTKEKCERPIGLQALLPRRSRRVSPHLGQGYAPADAPKGFPLALWKPSGTEAGEKLIGLQVSIHAAASASFLAGGKSGIDSQPPLVPPENRPLVLR